MIKTDQPPKLVHVLRNDALGGVEHSTLEVARYFASQGIEQQIVILSPLSGGISEKFSNENIPVISIPFKKSRSIHFLLIYLRNFRPEVQLVSGAFGLHAILSAIARFSGVKRCWTYLIMGPANHGVPYYAQYFMGQSARLFSIGEIAVSDHLKRMFGKLMHLPNRRISVIHRWRNIDSIYYLANDTRNRRNSENKILPIILSIGRLDWTKDFKNLINAFAIFIRYEPTAIFYIIGEGHLRNQLENQVDDLNLKSSVIFLGHRNEIATILGGSDIFLFSTSPTEGIGNVMIEAMAAGTPMICTDVGPCREVIGNDAGGVLVPPDDPEALAQAILLLWRDPIKRLKLTIQAHEYAKQRYTEEVCGQQLMTLLFPGR
jgi:glycosyltransferase involved in cell wall biosynthesis